ncbi:hypothetical protein QT381_00645 [Galbitalea sp. SE-J8]|uniref:hypothetical protein n=1 Tax=Galbitalea sp. SE-J8 TaxID=3054952 RepID=UPI00259D1770|nr:hypothetical protein [Galbitalea sp. SE-J8]MDM4761516.1 hypothetical protein [Galbitalea sp. SE-J8]
MSDLQRVGPVLVGAPPRASLLPPEIALEAAARRQRRGIIALVVLIVLVVAGGYAGATYLAQGAQTKLADAQNQTATLLAEQAQYAQISTVQSKVADIQADQATVTALDVDWKSFLRALDGTLPDGATLQSVAVTAATPITPIVAGGSPLDSAHIAEVTLTATTGDVPDIVAWITALSTLPGFVDATPTNVATVDGGYQSTFVVHIGDGALSKRFAPTDAAAGAGGDGAAGDAGSDAAGDGE